ncbi:MAG: flippase [Treponemataceae bacterium]|nr:flippase [Treponemataceae bacterium]
MPTQKSIKKNAVLNSIRTGLSLCFPLITFPYSTRILGPENIGKVNFAQSVVSYFSIFASLGILPYAVREAAKVRDDMQKLNQFALEIFAINMAATIAAYIFLSITLLSVPKLAEYRTLILICSMQIAFGTIGMDWIYSAMEDYFYTTVRSLAFQIVSLALLFLLVKDRNDYLLYAAITVIASVGSNILNFIHSRKYISFRHCGRLAVKKHLKPIFILFAFAIASSIFTTLDTTMIGFLSDDIQVGFYSAGVKLVRMIRNLFPAVFSVLFARLAYHHAHGDENSIIALSQKTMCFNFCFALPISAGLFLLMKPLVLLFCGPAYLAVIPVAKTMCPFILFSACSGFLGGGILIAYGKESIYLLTIIIAAAINFLLNMLLIPNHGVNGAALATLITEAFIMFFYFIYLRSFIKQLNLTLPFMQFLAATLIMGVAVYFMSTRFSNTVMQLIVPTIVGIIVYGTVLILFKNKYLLEQLKTIASKMRGPTKK